MNINLPGNTEFDPRKQDITELIEDQFAQKIVTRCGLPNAFFDFKQNERECLEKDVKLKEEM